ncbi:MAG: HPr kinase/phosphorylase [Mycoplasma sp.]|nr:HPr kinase/phosphorylase [Mycoplasma sp.]
MTAKDLLKNLGIPIKNKENIKEYINITAPGIYRAGLELNGFHVSKNQKNIIIWGTKEQSWFDNFSKEESLKNIDRVLSVCPPLLILSTGIKESLKEEILKICNKYNVPMASTDIHVSEISSLLSIQLAEEFAPSERVHACLVEIDGVGVMINGNSGIGKSEAVIELIQAGFNFISDDTVIIKRIGTKFIGAPSEITNGFLEVRGLGLIDVPYIYGTRTIREKTEIQLVIELVENDNKKDNEDRLGIKKNYFEILGSKIPKVIVPVKQGKSVTSLIIAAVNLFIADKQGHKPLKEITKRIRGV